MQPVRVKVSPTITVPTPRRRKRPRDPLWDAIICQNYGLAAQLAIELGISRQAIYLWYRVPSQHVEQVARMVGVPAKRLRPDLYRRRRAAVGSVPNLAEAPCE